MKATRRHFLGLLAAAPAVPAIAEVLPAAAGPVPVPADAPLKLGVGSVVADFPILYVRFYPDGSCFVSDEQGNQEPLVFLPQFINVKGDVR